MSERVLVVLSCGTNNPNRATRALFFAMVAKKKGKDVSVFLLDEAVYLFLDSFLLKLAECHVRFSAI